jgi:hypothetical protein
MRPVSLIYQIFTHYLNTDNDSSIRKRESATGEKPWGLYSLIVLFPSEFSLLHFSGSLVWQPGCVRAAAVLEPLFDSLTTPRRFLSTVQIGITLVGIIAGIFRSEEKMMDPRLCKKMTDLS